MTKEEKNDKKELVDILIKRQEQQLVFFSSLESIRWQFTSAFGIGALGSLILSYIKDFGHQFNLIVLLLVIFLSIGGLVTQIRIYALVVTIWKRILKIQKAESKLLKELYSINEEIQMSMYYPRVGIENKNIYYYLTVGMVSCAIFSIMIGIAIFALLIKTNLYQWIVIIISITISLVFTIISYKGSEYYMKAVENPIEEEY